MRRLERVINLLTALLETERPLTRAELRQRVPGYEGDERSARRSFERDKEVLRGMGLPLETELLDPEHPEDGTGYRIPKSEYQLPDPGLDAEEMAALALAASAVKLESQAGAAALWKLGGVPTSEAGADVQLADDEQLSTFFSARRQRRTVSFTYNGSPRQLDPYRLSFRNGHWYVNGHDHGHDEQRTYRLDRMAGEVTTSAPNAFTSPERAENPWLSPWQMGEGEPVAVRLLIDSDQAHLAVAQAGEDSVESVSTDGSVVLCLSVVNQEALRSFVLGFLDHAEILEPASMRREMLDYVRSLVAS